jgi:prolyl-tRNA synthetase
VVVRPTSETIINSYFAKWVQSYRDLPMLINQWSNVVRWELRPRLFLRTTEFLWQEGHTAHATEFEARDFALRILRDVYEDFMVDVMAVPILTGYKTERERFSGANTTWTCEAMMRDGKALQMGTSHELGQNFARVFNTTFLDDNGREVFVWQTSWGVSTRLMGALVMAHGDNDGLRLPPRLAPVQVVVLVVRDEGDTTARAAAVAAELAGRGVRVQLDDRVAVSFGRRVVNWELKGIPVRVEVGPRELSEGQVVLARRDDNSKRAVPLAELGPRVTDTLEAIQLGLLAEARAHLADATVKVATLAEAERAARTGFAAFPAAVLGPDGETQLNEAGCSVRVLHRADGSLALPDEPGADTDLTAVVARAY